VGDGRGQCDVAHSLATDLGLDDLDATLFTDDATMLHALVLAAVAFVVLYRTKDLRAEESIAFGLERPIIDGLRLLHLTERPLTDLVGRGQGDSKRIKGQRVFGLLEEIV